MQLMMKLEVEKINHISFNPRAGKVNLPKTVGKKSNLFKKTVKKSRENRGGYCSSINHRQINTTVRCSSCGDIICHCHDKSDPAPQAYSSRLTSDSDEKVMIEKEKLVVEQTKELKARTQMMQHEEERETVRLAISKMKITDLDENCHVMMDLKKLGLVFSYPSEENPLKNLGLYGNSLHKNKKNMICH